MATLITTMDVEPPTPLPDSEMSQWALDDDVAYLNHGCFGARLASIAAANREMIDWFEARPVERLDRGREEMVVEARQRVATFLRCEADDLGFVSNASEGANAVLRSLKLEPGDELVTTIDAYPAIRNAMDWVADRAGATVRVVEVPRPLHDPQVVVDRIRAVMTDRTRLVVVDHVTSPTALILPIEQIAAMGRERGVPVLVDGAHAPGMLDLDVPATGATYYTGNLHKWVCAPRGAAFLWVERDAQAGIAPTVVSNDFPDGFNAAFDWQGTREISPWLCAPRAIDAIEQQFGWDAVRRHNHALAVWAQQMLCAAWQVEPMSPADGSGIGSMAAVWLPPGAQARFDAPDDLRRVLYDDHRIEVPVIEMGDRWHVRVSCQIYNRPGEYERLAAAVTALLH